MAGIGVRLKRIYEKQTLVAHLVGFAYSIMVTIAPMLVVIGTVMLMSIVLGYDQVGYARRGLFAGTILYIFIFSLLTAAPFNAVLSRYMSDVIYEEKYENILPCYNIGMLLNLILSCALGIPFCIWERVVGGCGVGLLVTLGLPVALTLFSSSFLLSEDFFFLYRRDDIRIFIFGNFGKTSS